MPTRTSSCRRCCGRSGSTVATRRSRPSWSTAPRGCAGSTTGWSRSPRSDRRRRSTVRSSTRSGWGSTSCSVCGSPPTPRSTRPWPWPDRSTGSARPGSSTRCCAGSSERDREAWLDEVAPPGLEPLAATAVRTSHPEWVVRALRQALLGHGSATADDVDAQLDALLAADNAPPRVTLVARPGLADVSELLGDGASLAPLARTAVVLDHGDPGVDPGRARGTSRRAGRGVAAGRPGPRRGTGRGRRPAGSAGSTCAPARAARPDCSRAWPWNATPTWSPTRSTRTGPTWSAERWPP